MALPNISLATRLQFYHVILSDSTLCHVHCPGPLTATLRLVHQSGNTRRVRREKREQATGQCQILNVKYKITWA